MDTTIIWKSFKLGDLFERSTKKAVSINQKDLNISVLNSGDDIALISASRNGSGCVGYLKQVDIDRDKISVNKITFDDQWGFIYFQKEPFVITGGHNAILEVKLDNFKKLLDKNPFCYSFISIIINKITIKSEIFGYGYKINNKFDREIILLPCLEVKKEEDWIWEENGRYYTLAVEYIKKLMESAKVLREQKTILVYEAEKAKYETEYLRDKEKIIWKSFVLGKLMKINSKHVIKEQIKGVNISSIYKDGTVAVVTASKENNGIVGYIEENDEVRLKKRKGVLTVAPVAAYAGICFYQDNYVVSTGNNKLIDIIDLKFKCILDSNPDIYIFLSKLLTKNFCKTFYGFSKPITDRDFEKAIILLPCLEVKKEEDWIWEENDRYYTLAVDYISYIYLQGRSNYNQKLIDNYTYQY